MTQLNISRLVGAVATALIMAGCGGSGGTPPDSEDLTDGTTRYIDSAVSGVYYTCGDIDGITEEDGSFRFEKGKDCTFYLGNIELRDVGSRLLQDGGELYETEVSVARVLQSLDKDHNLDNGITIDEAIVQEMENKGYAALPDTAAEVEELVKDITSEGGQYISTEDARNHLEKSNPNLYSFAPIDAILKSDPGKLPITTFTNNDEGNRATREVEEIVSWYGDSTGARSCTKGTYKSTYTYNYANNTVTELFTVNNTVRCTIEYRFDAGKKPTQVVINGGTTYNIQYSNTGKIEKITDANNNRTVAEFDENGLLVRQENDQDNGIITVDTFEYSDKGQLIKKTQTWPDVTYVTIYEYHANGKIKSVTGSDSAFDRYFNEDGIELDGNGDPVICQEL